jgi:hypothetical protein
VYYAYSIVFVLCRIVYHNVVFKARNQPNARNLSTPYQNLVRDLPHPVLGAMLKIGQLHDEHFASLAYAKVRKSFTVCG